MIDAETALERIRWHAESGASAFENMGKDSAYVCARVRLLSILAVFDQYDGCDDLIRRYRSDVESPIGEKLIVRRGNVRQRGNVEVLRLEFSGLLRLGINDNGIEERDA